MSEARLVREPTPLEKAARLARPWSADAPQGYSPEELLEAVDTLNRHNVSVMALRNTHGNEILETALAPFVDDDRARYRREREEYEAIRQRFAREGIDAMLFKSAGLYPSFHYLSSNLDVIVRDGRAPDARRCLEALGYVELLNVEEPRKFLFRRFSGDGTTFAFHLHEVVGWGVPFLDNEPLWAHARHPGDDPDILIPGPREALLITLAHWFYEDKELALGNLFLTANALREFDGPLSEAAGLASNRGWEDGYWAALEIFERAWHNLFSERFLDGERREEVTRRLGGFSFMRDSILAHVRYESRMPAVVPFLRNKLVYYRKILRDPRRRAGRKAADVVATLLWAVRWKLHVRSQRPLLVSVSGCDGSGKTVQVERLGAVLDTCDIRSRVIWARGASSRVIAPLLRMGKLLVGHGNDAGNSGGGEAERFAERRRALGSPLKRWIFAAVYSCDLAWTYCIRVRASMLAGNVVVCDRYVYDALVDYTLYTGTPVGSAPLPLRWLARISPRPQVRLLLDVDPLEALRRKPEEGSTDHLEMARASFLAMADTEGLDVMPASSGVDEIQRRVDTMVLSSFYERYGTLCNAMLWSNPSQLNPRPGVR